jgi:hypothetical protein
MIGCAVFVQWLSVQRTDLAKEIERNEIIIIQECETMAL